MFLQCDKSTVYRSSYFSNFRIKNYSYELIACPQEAEIVLKTFLRNNCTEQYRKLWISIFETYLVSLKNGYFKKPKSASTSTCFYFTSNKVVITLRLLLICWCIKTLVIIEINHTNYPNIENKLTIIPSHS